METHNIVSVDKSAICGKEILTSREAAAYLGISMSYLYKLSYNREIPHYKPTGKLLYFNRRELESWVQSVRVSTSEEAERGAREYCRTKGGVI